MTPKVSVIVPIFNAGESLFECLLTLVNQTLKEIEIICVIDAPTDGCEKIAEKFSNEDCRVKIIYNEENYHVSQSRNIGLEAAIGEYIGFSDCDDTRLLNMYEELYSAAKDNNSDVVFSDAFIRVDSIDYLHCYNVSTKVEVIKSILLPMEHKNNKCYLSKSVWHSIYRRDMLMSNHIVFLDQRKFLSEDTLFNLKVFLNTKNVFHLNNAFYIWIKRKESLSNVWVDDIALKSIAYFETIFDELIKSNKFIENYNEWIVLLENYLRNYYLHYLKLKLTDRKRLSKVLIKGKFPLFSSYEDLKLFSKKRIKLYFFVSKLYLEFQLMHNKSEVQNL